VAKKSSAKLTVQGRGKKPKPADSEATTGGKKNETSDARTKEGKDSRPDSKPRGKKHREA
jgi:hypothetical protein